MADEVKPIENHCPFGCPDHNLDELGYCEHLLGFTSDGFVMEPLVLRRRFNRDAKEWVEDGSVMVDGRELEEVQSGDRRVNPQFEQADDHGIKHMAHRWVSDRVYSDDPDRKPIPFKAEKKQVVRRQMAAPVARQRAGMKPPPVVEEEATVKTPPKAKKPAKPRKRDAKGRIMKAEPVASDDEITNSLDEAVRSES